VLERARDPSVVRGRRGDPRQLDCPRCGLPANTDEKNPPPAKRTEPYKTHLAYVKERRSDADGEALLDEALGKLRARRGES
jgi:hypothetical protein